MKTFVRIVEAGSLTRAADSLDTSLPTVVRTLAALERELGVSLLKRTTRRLHLTDEGSQYLERCRDILAATQEAENILVARHTEPVGKLSVTASVWFGRRYLAPILCDFLRRNPKVSADVLLVDRVVNLIEEGIDVAVRIAHLKDSSLVAIPVGRVRRVVCASTQYLRGHGVPRMPDDIRRDSCVRHVGLGLGMFLSYMVAPHRKAGQLKYVLEKFEAEPMRVQVVYPQPRLMSHKVRTFVDECVGKLRRTAFD